ncbi:MAG TPA: hypothetical protein VGH87_29155 [Polyangiaceae bacterium]
MRAAAFLLLAISCKTETPKDTPKAAQASPQASAEPAPIATPLALSARVSPEGGPPPTPMRGDTALEPEAFGKEQAGYTINVVLRLPDAPAVTTGSPINAQTIDAVRKANEPRFTIDLTPTRMRLQLTSHGFLLARDSELRSRTDRFGHVFLTPDLASYRVLAPGSLRALFGERRADVSPLSPADVSIIGDGPMRLGYHTRKAEVHSRAGKGSFEIVRLPDLGDGGALFVRALLDLMNAPPQVAVVGSDELPVHAELHWSTRGALFFEVTSITKRVDLSATSMAVPPSGATFVTGALPPIVGELRAETKDLSALHTGAIDPTASSLSLVNTHDTPRFAWIDGAPVAWVAPEGRLELSPVQRGRYSLEWRTFLDDAGEPPKTLTVPATPQPADAGAH